MEGGEGVEEEGGKLSGHPRTGGFLPGEGDGEAEGELGGGDLGPGEVGGGEVAPGEQVSPVHIQQEVEGWPGGGWWRGTGGTHGPEHGYSPPR